MARTVYLHVGVPKSGTSYLQSTLWAHRDQLREHGVLLPGSGRHDHAWSTFTVREDPALAKRPRMALRAWDRVLADTAAWPGTAVISHEFFGAADAEQAARALAALAPAEVHLVVTARDGLSLLTASWQETLKYRNEETLDEFNRKISTDPLDVWNWRSLDAGEVLARWARDLPPERVHVVPVPRDPASRSELWRRFAGLFVDDPAVLDDSGGHRNESMGLVESELLRRVSSRLTVSTDDLSTKTWVRDYLGIEKLVPRRGERFLPGADRVAECRERSAEMVARLREAGYHVVGDLADLEVPDELPDRRTPADVTDTELAEAAASLIADLLVDHQRSTAALKESERRRRRLRKRLRQQQATPRPRPSYVKWLIAAFTRHGARLGPRE